MDHTGSTCWIRTPNGIRTRVTAVKGRGPRPLDDGGPVLLWTPVTRSAPQDLRKHTLPSPAAAKRQTSTWCDLGCIGSLIHCVPPRSEEHTSELQSRGQLVCRLLLAKKK